MTGCPPPPSPPKQTLLERPGQKPLPPLDLGVRALREYEVGEYIDLYGSAVDITDEQDEEMRMDTSELKADVGGECAIGRSADGPTVQRALQLNEKLLSVVLRSSSLCQCRRW